MYNRAFRNTALVLTCLVFLQGFLSVSFPLTASAASSSGINLLSAQATQIGTGFDSPFGLNVSSAARYGIYGQQQVPLNAAAGTGAGWDREEIRWDMVYRNGSWDWGFTDEAVTKAAAAGLNVLVLLDYNKDGSHTMPDLNAWAGYVQAVASHLKGKVHYYEVWNEPENGAYLAGANPQDYANLLVTSYNAIKAIDSSDQVVTAGVDGIVGEEFMEKVMQGGGEGHFDIIGVHPYVNPDSNRSFADNGNPFYGNSGSPENKYWVDDRLTYWTDFAARHGNKPLWATEFGWNTQDAVIGNGNQANYLARGFVEGVASGFQKLFIYNFNDESNQSYGLVSNWTNPKPSYTAVKNVIKELTGATFQQRIDFYSSTANTIADFGNGSNWWSYNYNGNTHTSITSQPSHSGTASLQVNYQISAGQAYSEIGPQGNGGSHALISLPGQPTKVGFWVYGDNNPVEFRIGLVDNNNQTFFTYVGKSGPANGGWHELAAYLPYRGNIAYPLKFKSIQLVLQPGEQAYSGALFIDDVFSESGSNVQDYRFTKNGQTLDAIWSDDGGSISLPTLSSTATAFDVNGSSTNLTASNGAFNLALGSDMLFIAHQASSGSNPTPTPPSTATCGSSSGNVKSGTNFSQTSFSNLWNRYDFYAAGNRSYVWGPNPLASGTEPYAQSPNGVRQVLYFDKSRMEITQPGADPNSAGYVTNGLLAKELISGQMQLGDDTFVACPAAKIPVAGDLDDTNGPTYAALASRLKDSSVAVGTSIVTTIAADGSVSSNSALSSYGVVGGYYVPQTNHTIAKPFWDFLNKGNQPIWLNGTKTFGTLFNPWYQAPGLPITEAYWAKVKVGGVVKDVLIQAFERRVLTYTPSNSTAFQVEWGNIGRHYYQWRYGTNPS